MKVYTTPTCHYCNVLKKELDDKGVEYEAIDVSQDQDAMLKIVEETGQMGVPVTEIDGEYIVGYDKDRFYSLGIL